MTRQEALAVMAMLKTAYPTFYKNLSKEDINAAVNLWATMFSEEPIQVVTEAIKALMCTLKFPPTIADVKDKIHLITSPKEMSEMEAWDKVRAAVSNSSYNAEEEYDKLPATIQRVIGSHNQLREWAMMDSDTFNSVIQSNFMRSLKTVQKQDREYQMLPESVKTMIEGVSLRLGAGENG